MCVWECGVYNRLLDQTLEMILLYCAYNVNNIYTMINDLKLCGLNTMV
jgi:hypothetical protein